MTFIYNQFLRAHLLDLLINLLIFISFSNIIHNECRRTWFTASTKQVSYALTDTEETITRLQGSAQSSLLKCYGCYFGDLIGPLTVREDISLTFLYAFETFFLQLG